MNKLFKEHFRINGGTFKTHEDEVEYYAKKIVIDFYKLTFLNNANFTLEQKDILAEGAYKKYKKHRNE
jgi:hypothetical protein